MIAAVLYLIKEKIKLFLIYDLFLVENCGCDRSNGKRDEALEVSRIPRLKAPQIAKINLIG